MIRKIFISFLFLLLGISYTGYSQSAQATMRVSVKVVSGTSIEATQPSIVKLSQYRSAELGDIKLNGLDADNVLVNFSEELILKDENGNQINLNITNEKQEKSGKSAQIKIKGQSDQEMKSGSYSGNLVANIEHL